MAPLEGGEDRKVMPPGSGPAGRADDRPGHRKLQSYDLPDWVRHPLKEQPLKVALLFPGEQTLPAGVLQHCRWKPRVAEMLEAARKALDLDVEEVMLEGPGKQADMIAVNQSLAYVADCAAFDLLREEHPEIAEKCQAVAGVGVGEIAALYAAGVITYAQGLQIVRSRIDALRQASGSEALEAVAVRGLPLDKLERNMKAAQKASGGQLHIVQYWCPSGFVVCGSARSVLQLQDSLREEAGVDVRLRLDQAHGGYGPAAKEASSKLALVLEALLPRMQAPRCELYLNQLGGRVPRGRNPRTFIGALKAHLSEPVQWESCVTQMLHWGVRQFYECGPNRSIKYMLGHYEHFIEAPLEILRPADFTTNVAV